MQSVSISSTSVEKAVMLTMITSFTLGTDLNSEEQELILKNTLKNMPQEYQKLLSTMKRRINEIV